MSMIVADIRTFLADEDATAPDAADVRASLDTLMTSDRFHTLVASLIALPAFSRELGRELAAANAVEAISACRMLRGALNMPLGEVFALLTRVIYAIEPNADAGWQRFAAAVEAIPDLSGVKLLAHLTKGVRDAATNTRYAQLADRLIDENPHALYPTSNYRACDGYVESTADYQTVEAVMSFSTFSSIKVVDRALDPAERLLRDIYRPLGRCVCLIDQNVEQHHGRELEAYFAHHAIPLERLVYRAMEVDKGIGTVERMLGDFKRLGVSRNEPVLIMGGGVLADTGGLACALYGRNTPYVMLSTSIVTGIDAGPSPRTCCDGFGYKNLMGAYHPPVVSITDRYFFGTLEEGWLRHGIAEIIKMAIVKNAELFADLEAAQPDLIRTRFGTVECTPDDTIHGLSQRILGGALRSYVEAEYDNLYETHQCRPHAYGHTWSPGFEIEAGLLHGHAVAICMGLGAFISHREGWIDEDALHRILRLLDGYGLSLWHDILRDRKVMAESHRKIVQKRGGNLAAPLPKSAIGRCGYLNDLSEEGLFAAIGDYEALCRSFPRQGRGIDPLCSDVGLEDPSTVMHRTLGA